MAWRSGRSMARNPCGCCQAISCPTPSYFFASCPREEWSRQVAAGTMSHCLLAGDDLGPAARDQALGLGIVGLDRIELFQGLGVRIDRRIIQQRLVDELLRSLVAVGVQHIVG